MGVLGFDEIHSSELTIDSRNTDLEKFGGQWIISTRTFYYAPNFLLIEEILGKYSFATLGKPPYLK